MYFYRDVFYSCLGRLKSSVFKVQYVESMDYKTVWILSNRLYDWLLQTTLDSLIQQTTVDWNLLDSIQACV